MMRRLIALLSGALLVTAVHASQSQISVIEPRSFGYFLGDTVSRSVVITVPAGTHLRTSALPQAGPRDYWLDLVASKLTTTERRSSTEHLLTLTYQIFYSALEPKRLRIPGFKLYFDGPGVAQPEPSNEPASDKETLPSNIASVAPLEIIVSPLREIIPEKSESSDSPPLRPDAIANAPGTGRARSGLLLSLVTGLGLTSALAFHYAWFPFGQRRNRPFARAARVLNALPDGSDQAQHYSENLIILHRAFDEAYGRRVLSGDVEKFIVERPEFSPLRPRVAEFYEASDLAFFAGRPLDARSMLSADAVTFLAHDLAALERQAA